MEQAVEQRGDGGGVGQLAHAEVVDDEERHTGQLDQVVLSGVGEGRLGKLFEKGCAPRGR